MTKVKGAPKTGGRKKGTPNKVNADIKAFLSELIDNNRQTIQEDLQTLDAKDRLVMLERFMGYVVPKQQAIAATVDYNKLTDEQFDSLIDGVAAAIEKE